MWPRWLALSLLGFPLTVGIIGALALIWPARPDMVALPWMLLVFPVWVVVMSLAFAFSSGKRAWLWLGGGTIVSLGLVLLLRAFGVTP